MLSHATTAREGAALAQPRSVATPSSPGTGPSMAPTFTPAVLTDYHTITSWAKVRPASHPVALGSGTGLCPLQSPACDPVKHVKWARQWKSRARGLQHPCTWLLVLVPGSQRGGGSRQT